MAGIGDSTLFPNSKMAAAAQLGQSRFRSGEITSVQPSGGAPATDPYFANVLLVASFEQAQTSGVTYTEQSSYARVLTANGIYNSNGPSSSCISSQQAEYGTASLRSNNTIAAQFASSADFDSISATNSSPYTIEFSYQQSSTGIGDQARPYSSSSVIFRWETDAPGGGSCSFFWNPGTGNQQLLVPSAQGVANTWYKYCVCKNSAGKIRFFRDGVMLGSVTPADSRIAPATAVLAVNQSSAAQTNFMDNIRVTKGICRYDSDSNYTVATGPFPTS